MKKYLKYEIKGTYKFVFGIMAIVLIASTIIQFNVNNATLSEFGKFFLIGVPILITCGAFITAFFHIIGSFRKELYEDRGYLTFALPLSGKQIVGAKLLVATLWFAVLGLTAFVYNGLVAIMIYKQNWVTILKEMAMVFDRIPVFTFAVLTGLAGITTLIMVYFSIALSRVTIKNKKIGGLWFILFLLMNSLYGYFLAMINKAVPYYLDIKTFQIIARGDIKTYEKGLVLAGFPFVPGAGTDTLYVGMGGLALMIAVGILMFYCTAYLIEEKIDL